MKADVFNAILDFRIGCMKTTLLDKAKEYASDSNRLHNFNMAAIMSRTTPEKALWGFMVKHLVSLRDMIDKLEDPSFGLSFELVNEKIGDTVNYLVLLEALFKERITRRDDRPGSV